MGNKSIQFDIDNNFVAKDMLQTLTLRCVSFHWVRHHSSSSSPPVSPSHLKATVVIFIILIVIVFIAVFRLLIILQNSTSTLLSRFRSALAPTYPIVLPVCTTTSSTKRTPRASISPCAPHPATRPGSRAVVRRGSEGLRGYVSTSSAPGIAL